MPDKEVSVRDLLEVTRAMVAGQRKAQLDDLPADQLQVAATAIQARTELERQVVQERAGNVIPGAWPVKKRLSVMKYVRRCVEPLDFGSLGKLDSKALSSLVEDAGLGYDTYLKRAMNGLKVRPKKQT